MDKAILKALNDQVNREAESAYYYLSMAAYFDNTSYTGFASWMKAQHAEEIEHMTKIYNFIYSRGGQVKFETLKALNGNWKKPIDVFQEGLKHEQEITQAINSLMDLAHSKKDYATISFLNWFVDEQVEEEASFNDILSQFEMIGDNRAGLLMLDRQLGNRVK